MYIVDVIPLAFVPRNQSQILSYFYKEPLGRGAVVEIGFGRQKVKGVVIGSDSIKNRKLDFKKSVDFSLKNISKVIDPEPLVANWQLEIARWISNYYYSPLGVCLKTVLPPFWMKKKYQVVSSKYQALNTKYLIRNTKFLITNLKQHGLDYENDINKIIQASQQVFLLVAENTAGNYFLEAYKKYNPVFISSGLSNKEYYKIWQEVQSGETGLMIGTRIGLFLPFKNLGLVIVDDESNEFYKSDRMPRYNGADTADFVAGLYGAEVIKSAVVPRIQGQTIDHGLGTKELISMTIDHRPSTIVIDMVDEIRAGNFSIFSRDLKEAIFNNVENSKNTILYIPRRGYANFIICEKCGSVPKCPNCSTSLVVHESVDNNYELRCHRCIYKNKKPDLCQNCGSYKLKSHGIGIEKAEKELKKMFEYAGQKVPVIFRLDSDTSKNDDKKEKEIIDSFTSVKGSILLATQVIFSHQYYLRVPLIATLNADTLINIPDFRAEESLFRQIYTLGSMADKMIIQTHNPEDVAIKLAGEGDVRGFIDREISSRKDFAYPPFSRLVKLTFRHKNSIKARNEAGILAEKLRQEFRIKNLELRITESPAFISRERGLYVWNIMIKCKVQSEKRKTENPEEIKKRNETLRIVPAGWLVDVDPSRAI